MSDTPTVAEFVRRAVEARLLDLHVGMPGSVVSYDRETQRASIQPLLKTPYKDPEGDRQVEQIPIINGVPVVFVGSGSFSLTWELAAGDTGFLMFAEASIDKWKTRGGEVDPIDDRRFSLSDAVFLPGLRSTANKLTGSNVHATALVIGAPLIHAGGTSSLALLAELQAMITEYNGHTHTGGTILGMTGMPNGGVAPAVGTQVLKGS